MFTGLEIDTVRNFLEQSDNIKKVKNKSQKHKQNSIQPNPKQNHEKNIAWIGHVADGGWGTGSNCSRSHGLYEGF